MVATLSVIKSQRPETDEEEEQPTASRPIVSFLDEQAMSSRLVQQTAEINTSKEELKAKAAAQLSFLASLGESLTCRSIYLEGSRKELIAQKDVLWNQREAHRLKQLSYLAEEARLDGEKAKAATEAQAAALGASANQTKKAGKK